MSRAKHTLMMALIATLLPTLAAAQLAGNQRIVTNVPFEFVVGNQIVPPGLYVVQSATLSGNALMLHNTSAGVGLISSDALDESRKASPTYGMVFKVYGSQHFLWKITVKGSRMSLRLPESRAEAELRARGESPTAEILLASK